MSSTESLSTPSDEVYVHLLDAALGRAVKSWKFAGQSEISIGRMPESDVEINDPYVSRVHAQLRYQDGAWLLVARGRNGVVVQNRQITELPLNAEVTFQLGSSGPMLRFCPEQEQQAQSDDSNCGRTLCFDVEPLPVFALDESKLHEEVGQITEGDYFQKLQAQAKSLRERRGL